MTYAEWLSFMRDQPKYQTRGSEEHRAWCHKLLEALCDNPLTMKVEERTLVMAVIKVAKFAHNGKYEEPLMDHFLLRLIRPTSHEINPTPAN